MSTANPIASRIGWLLATEATTDSDHDALDVVQDAYANLYPSDVEESGWNLSDALDVLGDDYPATAYDSVSVQESIARVRQLDARADWDGFTP